MNKTDLVKKVAVQMAVPQEVALRFVTVFEDAVKEAIREDGVMMIQGFGTFTHWAQNERPGRNPRTGVSVTIPARNSIKFKPGREMLRFLNGEGKD